MGQGVPVPIQARSIRAPISVSLLPIPHPVSVRPAPRTCLPCQPALSTHPSLSSLRPPTFMQPPVPPSMHTHSFLSLHSSIQLCRPQLLVHPSIPPCVFICPSLHPCTPLTPACLQPPAQPRAPVPLVRLSACPSEMRALQGLGAGLGLLSLGLALGALSSDTWLVARSPGFASSSGLWRICLNDACRPFLIVPDYLASSRAFLILAAGAGLVSLAMSLATFTYPWLLGQPLQLLAMGGYFIAGLFTLVAMSVYSMELSKSVSLYGDAVCFGSAFAMGWLVFPFTILSGERQLWLGWVGGEWLHLTELEGG
ncbi:uncharacterized protein LOC106737300 isoform X2 [Alligator mississippiensis]|uniref:uncharacterized protein LOC106737300 isoform X2 n=1 Tax=Alligator mississippiensis TaxID=8496 RepID=UPI002877D634|nr:uncharacterized protein LOC106737300 isoform X2 [Alligator mississippiensis]